MASVDNGFLKAPQKAKAKAKATAAAGVSISSIETKPVVVVLSWVFLNLASVSFRSMAMASPSIPNSLFLNRTFHSPARTFRTWPVYASQPPNNRQRPPPGVDTRIHWQNDEEGWIGGPRPSQSRRDQKEQNNNNNNNALGPSLADLLNNSSDSHYQYVSLASWLHMLR